MPEPDLIELFVARLGEIGAHYLVTGSVAATLYGEPRVTHDIELVVELSATHRDALPGIFPAEEFYREGGSPKHLRDIRSMLAVSSELIDLVTLEDWVRRRGLQVE